ncbi:MaoC family dehydratase [Mycobacterium sp. 050272]|uniref:MaoC family dehydratase n=1 Tax=Mycobacterium sp. 050272 TaxID=3142488 RepID=UPI00319ACA79
MTARVFASIEELQSAIGEGLGTTDWTQIDQAIVNRFADLTGDHQWIHVDVERAAASSFGGTIAHGYLTLSMLPAFGSRLYSIEAGSARLNYGLDKVRFPAAVPVGSKIRATATIRRVQTTPAGTQVVFGWVVEAAGVERPVCVAETVTLIVS